MRPRAVKTFQRMILVELKMRKVVGLSNLLQQFGPVWGPFLDLRIKNRT